MTSSMAKSQKIVERDCNLDRISSLPTNLIDRILELMPVRDAARTCVLSSTWRYFWAKQPSLVLDMNFWNDVRRNKLPDKPDIDFGSIVNSILLYHVGHIREFVIDLSIVSSVPHSIIDQWLSSLCRRSLKVLSLKNSRPRNPYKIPSWVFSTSELTRLSISYCIVKTAGTIKCPNIEELVLEHLDLDSTVFTTPMLTYLVIHKSRCIRNFNISAPRLATLTLHNNDYLNLKPFLTGTGIKSAGIYSTKHQRIESVSLVKLLATWPKISNLWTDGICLKYMAAGINLPLNLTHITLREIKVDSDLIESLLCVLRNSPLMHSFEIQFAANKLEEVNCMEEPISTLECRMKNLRKIKMKRFTATKGEVMLAKILLQCAPVLRKMLVKKDVKHYPNEQQKISNNLLLLQQEFPKPAIIYRPIAPKRKV